MPLDYSKFDNIDDSDDDDLPTPFGRGSESDCDESPRAVLSKRLSAHTDRVAPGNLGLSDSECFPVERFAKLAEGSDGRDDAWEVTAGARAAIQSAIAANDSEAPLRFVEALLRGLDRPEAVKFAVEQGPEMAPEVLETTVSGLVPVADCDRLLVLMLEKCRLRELYTFVLEAECGTDLSWRAKLRGISVIKDALLRMSPEKRHMFVTSCLPALLKAVSCPQESWSELIEALRDLAMAFLPPAEEDLLVKVLRSTVQTFLFKVLEKFYGAIRVTLTFGPAGSATVADAAQKLGESKSFAFTLEDVPSDVHRALATLVRDAHACSDQLQGTLEDLPLGDPTSDGGGDLELSPLCVASLMCLPELHDWCDMQVLPLALSPMRRLNALMRCCYVLVSNRSACDVVDVVDPGAAPSSNTSAASWELRGLALFVRCAAPLLRLSASQNPKVYSSLSDRCRWHPELVFRGLLEALTGTPNLGREVRGSLFHQIAAAMRLFDWPARFELYFGIIEHCRTDSVIGAVVVLFKDDWWSRVSAGPAACSLNDERTRLVKVLKSTLSGGLQVIDGMDTLTGTLNIARLVVMTQAPFGNFMRAALGKGCTLDLDSLLAGVSMQIDFEMGLLGAREDGQDMREVKRQRIDMVAHLVARVRELLAA